MPEGASSTAGIHLGSVASWLNGQGIVAGTVMVEVGFTTLGTNYSPNLYTAKVSPFLLFSASGAPWPLIPVAFGGTMQAAGTSGQTIQLQTSGGVALTEAVNVAALVQYATFQSQQLNFVTGAVNPGQNWQIVTTSAPAALCWLEVIRVEY